jgi:hypothetical protein
MFVHGIEDLVANFLYRLHEYAANTLAACFFLSTMMIMMHESRMAVARREM